MIRPDKHFLAATLLTLGCLFAPAARAAQLAGVTLPDTAQFGSQRLVLNGIGLRTFSFMHVHIYVAGLYLTQPTQDANNILQSPTPKILKLHFVHAVDAPKVRQAWRKGLVNNCIAPCQLNESELDRFLASLGPVAKGEEITMVFDKNGMDAYENGRALGRISDPDFARLMLAVFIGPNVGAVNLKKALLGDGQAS